MQNIVFLIRTLFTRGEENQSFIGATWVVWSIRLCPEPWRRALALRVLAWSPHYFYRDIAEEYKQLSYREFLEREFERNRQSRIKLRDLILAPYLNSGLTVLDYGCGPGFLAAAVADKTAKVIAVDLSRGVIECAASINQRDNLRYLPSRDFDQIPSESVDLSYSFAVIQHVTDDVFEQILNNVFRVLKPRGELTFHVVLQEEGWKAQSAWEADESVKGKIKLEYGLNCFSRSEDQVISLLERTGFSNIRIRAVADLCEDNFDDICRQHFLIASKAA